MSYLDFLNGWQQVSFALIFVALGAGIINYLAYKINYAGKKTYKEKFDLASEKEVKRLLVTHYFFASALFFFINTLQYETVSITIIWFFVRIFIGSSISVLYGYIAYLVLNFYYPGRLEKKLKKLRYTPRINPENGNRMKLLSEEEEDAYLDEGMQAEENVFSVDYDVWIDETTGFTKIEKYKGHLSALECDRCGFQTLRLNKEEILKEPTDTEDGEIEKEFKCTYCNRIRRKNVVLSKKIKEKSDKAVLIDDPLSQDAKISVIRIQMKLRSGEVKSYNFPNLSQAKNFMAQFDLDKLEEEVN